MTVTNWMESLYNLMTSLTKFMFFKHLKVALGFWPMKFWAGLLSLIPILCLNNNRWKCYSPWGILVDFKKKIHT